MLFLIPFYANKFVDDISNQNGQFSLVERTP